MQEPKYEMYCVKIFYDFTWGNVYKCPFMPDMTSKTDKQGILTQAQLTEKLSYWGDLQKYG